MSMMQHATVPTRAPTAVTWCRFDVWSLGEMSHIIDNLLGMMQRLDYSREDCFGMRLALEEAYVNAVKHGHQGDLSKPVELGYHVDAERVLAEIRDQGPGFDPHRIPSPLTEEGVERPSGRGVFLMRSFMTWIRYNQRGNAVTLCKCRSID
jgi:serine/threonine-protein kinase RsbW